MKKTLSALFLSTIFILNTFAIDLTKTVSVSQFKNTTKKTDFVWLEIALADMISNDLTSLKKVPIVTREQLKALLEEQQLQLSGIVDEKTAIKAGQIAGAGYIIIGDFIIPNSTNIRINLNVIDVETGKAIAATSVSGTPEQVFTLEKLLVLKLLESMSITLSETEKITLFQVSTNSIKALEQNYRGVIALEDNNKDSAKTYFEAAIAVDPYYKDAKQNLDKASLSFTGTSLFDNALSEIEQKKQQIAAVKEMREYFIRNLYIVKFDGKPVIISTNTSNNTANIGFKWHLEYNTSTLDKMYNYFIALSKANTGDIIDEIKILRPGKASPEVIKFKWFKEAKSNWFYSLTQIYWQPQFVLKSGSNEIATVRHPIKLYLGSSGTQYTIGDKKSFAYFKRSLYELSNITDIDWDSYYYSFYNCSNFDEIANANMITFSDIKTNQLDKLTGIELLTTNVKSSRGTDYTKNVFIEGYEYTY